MVLAPDEPDGALTRVSLILLHKAHLCKYSAHIRSSCDLVRKRSGPRCASGLIGLRIDHLELNIGQIPGGLRARFCQVILRRTLNMGFNPLTIIPDGMLSLRKPGFFEERWA